MDKRLAWVVLQRLPATGSATLQKLFHSFGGMDRIMAASSVQLSSYLAAPALRLFEEYRSLGEHSKAGQQGVRDLEWIDKNQAYLMTLDDPGYPCALKEIHHAPPVLMVSGDIEIFSQTLFAVVGSRKCSPSGLEHAAIFSAELASCGFVVTSGLAIGIDSAAHQGALSAGRPTIAVIATGIDLCYPGRHEKLARQIMECGAVVSEFPLGTPAQKENFPRRNRIISGLSAGVLVVEAEEKSGSLITARYAMEQNREVFAIPGAIKNPGSRGCHQLIREGAKLVENIDDILCELNHPFGRIAVDNDLIQNKNTRLTDSPSKELLTEPEKTFIEYLDTSVIGIDQLARRAGLPVEQTQALLLALEIKGWVESLAEGYRRA